MSRWSLPVCLSLVLLVLACSEPPNKEMDQAQGALDAARAAGAERFAALQFAGAADALARSRSAAATGDYRLALNHALDSRDRAQTAAREAADASARLTAEASRMLGEASALLEQVDKAVASAVRVRSSAATVRQSRATATAVRTALQEAGEALSRGDVSVATERLTGMKSKLEATLTALDEASRTQSLRRRR